MKRMTSILVATAALLIAGASCGTPSDPEKNPGTDPGNNPGEKQELTSLRWDFDNLDDWYYTHQDNATEDHYSLDNGLLSLWTRANSRDRSKVRTYQNDFIDGTYSWRINVPAIPAGEQASIAGFIYMDDHHELDFEIGYGSKAVREEYGIKDGELVACMTNQDFPFKSGYVPIVPGWHTFAIKMEIKNGFYVAHWLIDGVEKQVLDLDFDEEDAQFRIYCSVENLLFIGDKIPEHETRAKFDYVSFEGNVSGAWDGSKVKEEEAKTDPEPGPGPNPNDPKDDPVIIGWNEKTWDFDSNIDGWYYYTHNPEQGAQCYSIEDGCVKIWTNANTLDRNKLHTNSKYYSEGEYIFKLLVTDIAPGEKCSIGAFIYQDDKHELDFEIGYGTVADRNKCGAKEDEMVCHMTNQANPFKSVPVPITKGWHVCMLKLEDQDGKFFATWHIDDVQVHSLKLNFGKETRFLISVSVENLHFLGDHTPTHTNYALFDYVTYRSPIYN